MKKKATRKARDPHPADELRSLEQALGKGLARGYVLRGEERFFKDHGVRRIVAAATERGFEICKHDVKDPEFALARLMDDLTGGALFASARCILVQNADSLLKKGARGFAPHAVDAIAARLASSEEGTVVISAEKLRADHATVKAIKKVDGVMISCRRLWDTPPPWDPDPRKAELVQWYAGRARERGVKLTLEEAAYVVVATGNDLYALDSQLERLKDRGAEGIKELVSWEAGGSPYGVAEELLCGNAARAVAGLEALFRAGFQGRDGARTLDQGGLVNILLGAMVGKLRETLTGARVLAAGGDPGTAAATAGAMAPMAKRAFDARVVRRALPEWKRLLSETAELERRSRSGATVDVNDFCTLALRWAKRARR